MRLLALALFAWLLVGCATLPSGEKESFEAWHARTAKTVDTCVYNTLVAILGLRGDLFYDLCGDGVSKQ